MKAAVIDKVNSIHIKELEKPVLQEGEALIKVKYCGICGSDIHVLKGEHKSAQFPVISGHEFVGELVEIKGSNADNFQIGDMVAAQPFYSCGNCEPCAKGQDNVCENLDFMGVHRDGGFAEYAKVLVRKMYRIPKDMDIKLAALAEPVAVAVHDVRKSGLQVGETALIIGGGPIGMLIALIAEYAGARKVVISEISEYRRNFAEEMGFKTLNPLSDTFEQELSELTDKKGFDVVYEVSGSKQGMKSAIEHTKITGTIMVIGMSAEPYPVDLSTVFSKELNIKGARIHAQYNFIGAIEILKHGMYNDKFSRLISKIFPLDQIEEAFDYAMKPGDFFKVLVEM